MKIIAEYIGGSVSYSLNNADSDRDDRNIFLNTEISKIIGLSKEDHQNKLNKDEDIQGFELRHALKLLKKGNSQLVEFLFNNKWTVYTPEFKLIQDNKFSLLDSYSIYKCFRAYSFSERQLVFGRNNTGRLGEKRKKAIETYGYSFRNSVHAFRLIRGATIFFKEDYFPVDIVNCDKEYGQLIRDIKVNPGNHNPVDIENQLIELEKELDSSYNNRKNTYVFNEELANNICLELYYPILKEKYAE